MRDIERQRDNGCGYRGINNRYRRNFEQNMLCRKFGQGEKLNENAQRKEGRKRSKEKEREGGAAVSKQ